ncbi:UNVERIFIED_CONTAM: hypothetical protein Sradi_5230600 [Sesamum radiatum]|uniref:Reverse transcriptase n=1 Tax=Sesamum radiatum TaxID=300843 RepID=A0AAW2LPM2_SESRA
MVRVSEDMGASLNQPFSVDEVRTAISQMHPCKSPGPDMSCLFYKYWNMVGNEVNHFLARKYWGSMGQVALKLDLSKAHDRVEWNFLERVLTKLEATSSLMINLEKSLMTFSKNTTMEGQSELAAVLGVQIVEKHDKCLGLSAAVGRLKRAVGVLYLALYNGDARFDSGGFSLVDRDGQNVSIWRDRWIPRPVLFKVLTAPHSLEPNATVSALLMERDQSNEELISAMFVTEDAVAILSIPVKRGMVLALAL